MDDCEPVLALPATEAYPAHDNTDQSDGRPVSCSDSDVSASIGEEEESDSGTDEYYEQGRRWGARRAASKSSMRKRRKRPEWTRSEEETLAQLHCGVGNQWSHIAARLPGRTANEVKNIWHSTLRSKHLKARSLLRAYATTLNGRWDDEAARQEAYNAAVRLHGGDDSQEAPDGTTQPSGGRRSQTSQLCVTSNANGGLDTNVQTTSISQQQHTNNTNKSTPAASAPRRTARGATSAENLRPAGGRHGGRNGPCPQQLQAAPRAAQPEPSDSEAEAPVANLGGPTSPSSAAYHAPLPSTGADGVCMLPLKPGGFLSLPPVSTTTVHAARRESQTSALEGRVAVPIGSKRSFEASFGTAPWTSPNQQRSSHFDQPNFQANMPPAYPPHSRTWAECVGYDVHAGPIHHMTLTSEPEPTNLLHSSLQNVIKAEPDEPARLQCPGPEANRVFGLDTWPDRSEPAIMLPEDDNDMRHPGADTGSSTAVRALSMAADPLASAAPTCSGAFHTAAKNCQRFMGSSEPSLWIEQGPAIGGAWSSNAQGALFARPQLDLPPSGSQQPYAAAPTVSSQHGASSASGSGPMSRLSSYQGHSGPWHPGGTSSALYSSAEGAMTWPHGFFAAVRPASSEAPGGPGLHGGWPSAYRQTLFSGPPAMWSPFANGWRPQHLGGHMLGDMYEGNMGPMSAPPSQRPYDCRTLFDQYDKHHSARQGLSYQQATPWCPVQEQHFQQYQEQHPPEQHVGQQRMFRQQPHHSQQVKSFHEQQQGNEQQQEVPQQPQCHDEQDTKNAQEQILLLEQERPSEIFTMGLDSLEDPQLRWCISEDTTLTFL